MATKSQSLTSSIKGHCTNCKKLNGYDLMGQKLLWNNWKYTVTWSSKDVIHVP